jgi:hypothetical protein
LPQQSTSQHAKMGHLLLSWGSVKMPAWLFSCPAVFTISDINVMTLIKCSVIHLYFKSRCIIIRPWASREMQTAWWCLFVRCVDLLFASILASEIVWVGSRG